MDEIIHDMMSTEVKSKAAEIVEGENPDNELTTKEFARVIVRLASRHAGCAPNGTLSEKVRSLITERIAQYAKRKVVGSIREMMSWPEVRDVLLHHRANLLKVFKVFAGADNTTNSSKTALLTINIREFGDMVNFAKLIDGVFSFRMAKLVFRNVQRQDLGVEVGGGDDESEMVFSEFQESLLAMTFYKICDPYTPLSKRLADFIEHMFLPCLMVSLRCFSFPLDRACCAGALHTAYPVPASLAFP
jgi:hypothetical protein